MQATHPRQRSNKVFTHDILLYEGHLGMTHKSGSGGAPERHAATASGAGAADGGHGDERAAPEAAQKRRLRDPKVGVARPAGAGGVQLLQACQRSSGCTLTTVPPPHRRQSAALACNMGAAGKQAHSLCSMSSTFRSLPAVNTSRLRPEAQMTPRTASSASSCSSVASSSRLQQT